MSFHNEDELIARLTRSWKQPALVKLGPGHDCAALAPLPKDSLPVLKTDALVENVHFLRSQSPKQIGHKAVARVLSDFAAAGARPLALMIALGLPKNLPWPFLRGCYAGMEKTASQFKTALVGGETTRSEQLWFCVSGLGMARAGSLQSRGGASPGDLLFVTGRLGQSGRGRHLRFVPRLEESAWLVKKNFPTAMMDLSDGLGKDLPRLATASRVSFEVDPAKIPRAAGATVFQAVNDGEDFELLFTVKKNRAAALLRSWPFSTPLTALGEILPAGEAPRHGRVPFSGFDHLRPRRK